MEWVVSLVLIVSAGILLEFLWKKKMRKKDELPLPPGPRGWPLIGNLLQTSPIPHQAMMEMNREHGPVVFLKLGQVPAIVTDDPGVVKSILKSQDGFFASRPANIASQHFTFGGKDIAFAPYGSHWRAMRRICTLQLLAPRRLEDFRGDRRDEVGLMVREVFERERGKAIWMRDLFGGLASNNLTRMLLGKRFFGAGEAGAIDGAEHREMIYEAFSLVNAFNLGDYVPLLRWFDLQGHEKRMKQLMRKTNLLYDSVILEQANRRASRPGDQSGSSFVEFLLDQGLSHTVIKAVLIDMAAAGTDTTSITSEWTMAELVRHPRVLSKVREEIERVIGGVDRVVEEDDIKHLHYLRAVVKEVLRLHPVGAFLIPHVSIQETVLGGYRIPKNTRALINTYSLGRNPAVWELPLEFRPERFVGEDLESLFDPEYRMVPFGAGRRGCPGAALGSCMILFGVASLVHAFDWETVDGGEVDVSLAYNSVVLEKPLQLCASPRLARHLYSP